MNELKTKIQNHVSSILRCLEAIEERQEKKNGWIRLLNIVTSNPDWKDDAVLREMINQLGENCLRKLIFQIADKTISDLDKKIEARSNDLIMKIKEQP